MYNSYHNCNLPNICEKMNHLLKKSKNNFQDYYEY